MKPVREEAMNAFDTTLIFLSAGIVPTVPGLAQLIRARSSTSKGSSVKKKTA